MLSQFVYQATDFSSQYGSDNTISYTAGNSTGKPTVYPNYGDSNHTFAFRTYGPWWTSSKFYSLNKEILFQDFLEVKLEKRVCPYLFKIYETYNPGAATRILAYDTKSSSWIVLWASAPQNVEQNSRIFSPALSSNNFLTDIFRIEFSHHHLEYYYEVDAFEVTGSLIALKNYTTETTQKLDNSSDAESVNRKQILITSLPSEVFNLVLSYLNLESLCKASQVSKFFRRHCYDSVLYQRLNLQPFWPQINDNALRGLTTRCQSLQELNLSWCGSQNSISPDVFIQFIQCCGQSLTCLDLSNCSFLNAECLSIITRISVLLDTLSLKNDIYNAGLTQVLSDVSNLKNLQCLNLYRTHVDTHSLLEIIKSCQNLEHLCLGGCSQVTNFDIVALQIGTHLRRLRTLDLWRARSLSALGIQYICDGCPELEDLDIGWCDFIDTSVGCVQQLAAKCTNLKRLILSSIRSLSNTDLLSVSLSCRGLEQIDIMGTRDITPPTVEQFLFLTPNLKLLDISFSAQITAVHISNWTSMFPNVSIKHSLKTIFV